MRKIRKEDIGNLFLVLCMIVGVCLIIFGEIYPKDVEIDTTVVDKKERIEGLFSPDTESIL